jgi:hypothetical protein
VHESRIALRCKLDKRPVPWPLEQTCDLTKPWARRRARAWYRDHIPIAERLYIEYTQNEEE